MNAERTDKSVGGALIERKFHEAPICGNFTTLAVYGRPQTERERMTLPSMAACCAAYSDYIE